MTIFHVLKYPPEEICHRFQNEPKIGYEDLLPKEILKQFRKERDARCIWRPTEDILRQVLIEYDGDEI